MTPPEIKAARAALGLTQPQLAARLGVDRNTLNRWEMGKHPIRPAAERLLQTLVKESRL